MANTPMQDDPHAYWNEQAGPRWARVQTRMDGVMEPITRRLFEVAAPTAGESAIDVGCGCGSTTIELARAVGHSGSVVGVDISAPMLDIAQSRADGAPHLRFEQADAATYDFGEQSADLLLSRFGVMFFEDSHKAFRNFAGALGRDGRCAFACWQPAENNPWVSFAVRAIADMLTPPEMPTGDVPGPFRFADPQATTAMLRASGFIDVDVTSFCPRLAFAGSVEEIIEFFELVGPLSRALDELEPDLQAEARRRIQGAFGEIHDGTGVTMDAATWLVTARPGG